MDAWQKTEILGQAAQYDLCGSCLCQGKAGHRTRSPVGRWIYPAARPDGKEILLLKVLMSNACENDCFDCVNRCSIDYRRTNFTPEELAKIFNDLWQRRMVQGLFLSSAVAGGTERTMSNMLAAVEIVRRRYRFRGYVHLKILPGASYGAVEQAVRLADRVSLNVEAPTREHLQRIAGKKDFEIDLLLRMKWVHELVEKSGKAPTTAHATGQTTQFVVGAAGESDREILTATDRFYQELHLARAYYSAFQPVKGTPLEHHRATPLTREHRLYQSDFLLRRYGFASDEIVFDKKGNLPLEADPKLVWALNHPERFPIEVNRASKEELLRIPGIGPRSTTRILQMRGVTKFRSLSDLKRIGAVAKRAGSFVLLDGKRPQSENSGQMGLWGC